MANQTQIISAHFQTTKITSAQSSDKIEIVTTTNVNLSIVVFQDERRYANNSQFQMPCVFLC